MRGRKRDQCILTAYIATLQTFGVEAVVAVLGGGGQFHALLGEVYVGEQRLLRGLMQE